jgi:uncharacterized membrane protein YqiK
MVTTSIILTIVVAILAMIAIYVASYKTVPPHRAMVVFRGRRKEGDEPRSIVSGGGRFVIPGGESYHMLDLTADLVRIELSGVDTSSGGVQMRMRVQVAAVWKISSDTSSLEANAGKLVERTRGENQMAIKDWLERAVRDIAASVTLEEFETDRDLVSAKISYTAADLMNELGLEIRSLVFLSIRPQG